MKRQSVSPSPLERLEPRVLFSGVAAGTLDPTFGTGGVAVVAPEAGFSSIAAMDEVLLPGGDILAGGYADVANSSNVDFALARFLPNGRLDPGFGKGTGIVFTDFGGTAIGSSMALCPNGEVLVTGSLLNGAHGMSDFAAASYFSNGKLDPHFGVKGTLTTDLGGDDFAGALTILASGKFIIAGTSDNSRLGGLFAAVRYYPNGTVDKTFGDFGKALTRVPGGLAAEGNAITALPNGELLLAGQIGNDFGIVRYNANGVLDKSFGKGGFVTTTFTGNGAYANAMAMASDGKFVLAGYAATDSPFGTSNFGIARYNANGSLDSSFGTGGTVITGIAGNPGQDIPGGGIANAVTVAPDGKIVAAGISMDDADNAQSLFTVIRYDPTGELDASFAHGGIAVTNIGPDTADQARAVAIQPDGKILAAGFADVSGAVGFGLVRYFG